MENETLEAKLRNQLSPLYGLANGIIGMETHPENAEALKILLIRQAKEAIKSQDIIRSLLSEIEAKTPPYKEWSTDPDEDGSINIPDHLDKLFHKLGMQLRFHTISDKNEIQTIADMVNIADEYFNKK